MTPQALQRFVVRMHFDPALVARVYQGEPIEGLDARSRELLVAVDQRAWATDPFRRSRALTALIEEYPASSALAGVRALDPFFRADSFHHMVEHRGSMALAFGDWLASVVGDVARLEQAIVQARRCGDRAPGDGWCLAPGIVPVVVCMGTLDRMQSLRHRLGSDPVRAIVEGRVDTSDLPEPGTVQEHWLVERTGDGGVGLQPVDAALVGLLDHARIPRSHAALIGEAVRLGAGPEDAADVVAGLVADGLLLEG